MHSYGMYPCDRVTLSKGDLSKQLTQGQPCVHTWNSEGLRRNGISYQALGYTRV